MKENRILFIYTQQSSARLRYIFDLILREILGIEYNITHNADEFSFHTGPKLNYSNKAIGDELFIFSSPLLFEKGIRDQQIAVFDWMDTKAFFASHPGFAIPFDPFAASFYLVSRYEEYLPHQRDMHNRFDAAASLAFQKGFLHKPVVNIYALKIKDLIKSFYPEFNFPKFEYKFISTIDVDNAWAYREKGILRSTGAMIRSLSQFDFKEIKERVSVLLGFKKDPYDTYQLLKTTNDKYHIRCIYFFLLGDYGENDKNVSASRQKFQSLIKSISDYNEIGIHPSYASYGHPERMRLEQSRLQKIIHREVTNSRQHFLRLQLPSTYRNLLECDITDDYTMGFAWQIGFRAGICTPFYFYDLSTEQATRLLVHPFAVMDATLRHYMKLKPAEVMAFVTPLIREVKNVNGTFILLWHNESLSNKKPWEEWQEVYEDIVRIAVPQNSNS